MDRGHPIRRRPGGSEAHRSLQVVPRNIEASPGGQTLAHEHGLTGENRSRGRIIPGAAQEERTDRILGCTPEKKKALGWGLGLRHASAPQLLVSYIRERRAGALNKKTQGVNPGFVAAASFERTAMPQHYAVW